jgi:Asp-tRNA(Asn)/Glu-tRNA(Gln) amidotransferase B subunit
MAIQLNLSTSQYGVPFAGAYFRIVTASVSRTRNADIRHSVMIDVAGYATRPSDDDTRDVDFRRYHCPLAEVEAKTGDIFLAKCYAWVMAQDNMNGAQAV